jgi:GTP-binding protein
MALYPDARFLTSAHQAAQFVPDTGREVAFAGRSNAGKSSAINAILGRRDFARTSKTPGRTQLVNFFALDDRHRLVDLPGYGYARVSRAVRAYWQELMEEYFRDRRSLSGLFMAVDSRRGLGDFDWQMLDWARALGCPVHVLLTKADKLGREESARVLAGCRQELGQQQGSGATVQLFSATSRLGVDQARQHLARFLSGNGAREPRINGTA